jgi:hypothetical protein
MTKSSALWGRGWGRPLQVSKVLVNWKWSLKDNSFAVKPQDSCRIIVIAREMLISLTNTFWDLIALKTEN